MMKTPNAEDELLGPWVYCAQHLRPHESGWCTVSLRDKVGLGKFEGSVQEQLQQAGEKCERFGLLVR